MKNLIFDTQIFADLVAESECGISLTDLLMNLERQLLAALLSSSSMDSFVLTRELAIALDLDYTDIARLASYIYARFNGKASDDIEKSNLFLCMIECCEVNFIEAIYLNLVKVGQTEGRINFYAIMFVALAKSLQIPTVDILKLATYLARTEIKPYSKSTLQHWKQINI